MTEKQIWETIALDLKRAANYLHFNRKAQADYYLSEARGLFENQSPTPNMTMILDFVKFSGSPEDILLGSSLISCRI